MRVILSRPAENQQTEKSLPATVTGSTGLEERASIDVSLK